MVLRGIRKVIRVLSGVKVSSFPAGMKPRLAKPGFTVGVVVLSMSVLLVLLFQGMYQEFRRNALPLMSVVATT